MIAQKLLSQIHHGCILLQHVERMPFTPVVQKSLECFTHEVVSSESAADSVKTAIFKIYNKIRSENHFEKITKSDYFKSIKKSDFLNAVKLIDELSADSLKTFEGKLNDGTLKREDVSSLVFCNKGKLIDNYTLSVAITDYAEALLSSAETLRTNIIEKPADVKLDVLELSGILNIKNEVPNFEVRRNDKGLEIELNKHGKSSNLTKQDAVKWLKSLPNTIIKFETRLSRLSVKLNTLLKSVEKEDAKIMANVVGYIHSVMKIIHVMVVNFILHTSILINHFLGSAALQKNEITIESDRSDKITFGGLFNIDLKIVEKQTSTVVNSILYETLASIITYFVILIKFCLLSIVTTVLLGVSLPVVPIAVGLTLLDLFVRLRREWEQKRLARGE